MRDKKPAALYLENGLYLRGYSVGACGTRIAPLASSSNIVGHQEIVTDPAFAGLILSLSMPQVGNVGAKKSSNESKQAQVAGLLIKDLSPIPSNWQSEQAFEEFLIQEGLVTIAGLDTRALALVLTKEGTQKVIISTEILDKEELKDMLEAAQESALSLQELHPSVAESYFATTGSKKVVTLDTGIRNSLIKTFVENDIELLVLPSTATAAEVLSHSPHGIFLGSGPSLASLDEALVATIKELIGAVPIFGVQYGHFLLAAALGAQVISEKAGTYAANIPVKELAKDKVEIVSKASAHRIESSTLPEDVIVTHKNMHDESIEGIAHAEKNAFSVSFFPQGQIFQKANHALMDTFIAALEN